MRNLYKLLAFFMIARLNGCVLEDHQMPERVRVIKHQTLNYGTYNYTYVGTGRLSKEIFLPVTVTPYSIDFTSYDPSSRLLEAVQYFSDPFPDLAQEVLRDADGKITRIRKYCVVGTCTSGIWYFTYPSANTVEVKFWDNGSIFVRTDLYTFNGAGQITEVKYYNSANLLVTTTTNTAFEIKKNMLSYYPDGFLTAPTGNNNVLAFQRLTHSTSAVTNGVYTYEYNTQGSVTRRLTGTSEDVLEYESY